MRKPSPKNITVIQKVPNLIPVQNRSLFDTRILLILTGICLVVGLWLRVSHLDRAGLWSDELYSVSIAYLVGHQPGQVPRDIRFVSPHSLEPEDNFWSWKLTDPHPPLYEIVLSAWIKLFGHSDAAVRTLSVVFGMLLVMSGLLLWRESPQIASYYTSAMALSLQLIFYSQEARNYALAALLCGLLVLQVVANIKRSEGDVSRLRLPAFALVTIFMAGFTHYYTLLLSGSICLIYSCFHLKQRSYLNISRMLLPLLALLPYLWLARTGLSVKLDNKNLGVGGYMQSIFNTASDFITFSLPDILPFVIIGGILILAVGAITKRELVMEFGVGSWDLVVRILIAWLVLYLVAMGIATATAPFFHPRYLIFALPLVLLILAIFIERIKLPPVIKIFFLIAVMSFSSSQSWNSTMQRNDLPDYRSAAQWLASQYREGDRIIVSWRPNLIYYLHYLASYLTPDIRYAIDAYFDEQDIQDMCASLPNDEILSKVYFYYFEGHVSQVEAFGRYCGKYYSLIEHKKFRAMFVDTYEYRLTEPQE